MGPYGLELSSGPAAEPVSTDDMKDFLRVDSSDDDALIASLVKAARRWAEDYTGRTLINQTWNLWLDRFVGRASDDWWDGVKEGPISSLYGRDSGREIELPKAPLSSVTSISTFAQDDTETTFEAANYIVDTKSSKGRVVLKDGVVWPTALREANAIKIVFVAGYGAAASSVPDDIVTAIKQLVAHWYENREPVVVGQSVAEVPMVVTALLNAHRLVEL